jgi:hypothetical protein
MVWLNSKLDGKSVNIAKFNSLGRGFISQPALAILFVFTEVPIVKIGLRIPLKGQDVGADSV